MATPRKSRTMFPSLDQVKADRASGMTPKEMCQAYGITKGGIMRFLKRNGLTSPLRITYPDDDLIVAGLQSGETVASMAKRFGISSHSLRLRIIDRRLRDLVEPPPPPEPKGLRPGPAKVINELGISIPRIPTIHGYFEARS